MPQFNNTASIVPLTIFGAEGQIAFLPPGVLTSSLNVTGSAVTNLINETASFVIEFDTGSSALEFRIPSESAKESEDIIALHVTTSGINPRVGIGTTNPITTFEFKETSDTNKGSELLLVGSRTTKGANVGDSAGIINFAIDTGSADFIETGSVGKIKGVVTAESADGVQGKLVLELFKDNHQSDDIVEFGYGLGEGITLFNAIYTSSIEIVDFSQTGFSKFIMRDYEGNLMLSASQGHVSASGDITANSFIGTVNGGSF